MMLSSFPYIPLPSRLGERREEVRHLAQENPCA